MPASDNAILFFWHTSHCCYLVCSVILIAEKVPTSGIQNYLVSGAVLDGTNVFLVCNYEKQEMGNGQKQEQPRPGKDRKLQVDFLGNCRK